MYVFWLLSTLWRIHTAIFIRVHYTTKYYLVIALFVLVVPFFDIYWWLCLSAIHFWKSLLLGTFPTIVFVGEIVSFIWGEVQQYSFSNRPKLKCGHFVKRSNVRFLYCGKSDIIYWYLHKHSILKLLGMNAWLVCI